MKTVVGLFDDMDQAQRATRDLENAGIPRDDISVVANNEGNRYTTTDTGTTGEPEVTGHAVGHDAVVGAEIGGAAGLLIGLTGLAIPGLGWIAGAGWLMGLISGAATGAVIGGLVGALTHVGVPHEDAANYTEGVRRGGILLAVKAQDDVAHNVAQILSDDGAVNIDERASQYRQEGFVPPAPVTSTTTPLSTAVDTTTRPTDTATDLRDQAVIPVVEEELAVGKREVQRGGVRVYSHVTERPVEENVNLHEEHVTVDRRPVDRPVTGADVDNLRDQSFELRETAEEAVVSKDARVVEEVVVGKQGTDRTETVRDSVRRTDVDVDELNEDEENLRTDRPATTGRSSY